MDRFDIKSFRPNVNGKAYTVRLGSAWTDKNGRLQLAFDALPVADDKGNVRAFLEPREATGETRQAQPARGATPRATDMSDDIPFGMEWR